MALLNNLYIFVEDEDVSKKVESTSHPVEKGIEITDTIRRQATVLSLSGYIVDTGSVKASAIETKINQLKDKGSLITYTGRNVFSNMQIQSFDTSYPNTVWGGCKFSMELKEVRIAKSAYTEKKATKAKANTTKPVTSLKAGDTVIFKGGNVYVSSDAKKAAAKRNKSTCKITIPNSKSSPIRTESWAIHPYHLVSTDGGKVYGWVDKANIEPISSNKTAAKTKGGTQQASTKAKAKTPVYHTVKSGDTVYKLVTQKYKSLGSTSKWVINNNPKAFSRKGDATTLKVKAKLLMGYKK